MPEIAGADAPTPDEHAAGAIEKRQTDARPVKLTGAAMQSGIDAAPAGTMMMPREVAGGQPCDR